MYIYVSGFFLDYFFENKKARIFRAFLLVTP